MYYNLYSLYDQQTEENLNNSIYLRQNKLVFFWGTGQRLIFLIDKRQKYGICLHIKTRCIPHSLFNDLYLRPSRSEYPY